MLEEVGEPYETVWLEYQADMKAPDYLKINPMGKVPALQHRGAIITEASAICAYLAAAFEEKNLMPAKDSPALAAYFRWLFFAAGPLEMAVTVKSMDWPVKEENSRSLGYGEYATTLNAIEAALAPGPYICGEQFTAADVYVGMHLEFSMLFGNLEKREAFEAYVQRLRESPAYQRAQQICQEKSQTQSA